MKIKLKCITAGFKFGDIVEVGKKGIDAKIAKGLIKDGLAVEVTDVVAVKTEEEK